MKVAMTTNLENKFQQESAEEEQYKSTMDYMQIKDGQYTKTIYTMVRRYPRTSLLFVSGAGISGNPVTEFGGKPYTGSSERSEPNPIKALVHVEAQRCARYA